MSIEPVFLDTTGRRRRVVSWTGLGIGLVLGSFILVIIAGLAGVTSGHLPPVPWPSSASQSPTEPLPALLEKQAP